MRLERIDGPGGRKPRVACVLDAHQRGLPTACAYIRLILPLSAPEARKRFDIQFVTADEIGLVRAQAIIVQRLAFASDAAIDGLLEHCRKTGARLVYEIDDDLLAIARDHTEYGYYSEVGAHIRRLIHEADEVWVSTEALAARLRPFSSHIVVVQNDLDGRLWSRVQPTAPASKLRLLYMGSATHSGDFHELLKPAFELLRRELSERVGLTLIGVAEKASLSEGMRMLLPPPGIGTSYPSFASWLQSLREFDIGLAPLLSTELNQSKSHIKWLEYSAMGLATVASDIAEYRVSISSGTSGVLVENRPKAFFEALRALALQSAKLADLKQAAADLANRRMAEPGATLQRLDRISSLLGASAPERSGLDQIRTARK